MAAKTIKPKEWDTIGKASKAFGIPRTTIVSWVAAGYLIPTELAGGTVIVRFNDVKKLQKNPPPRGNPRHRET